MSHFTKPAEKLARNVKEYLDLKTDDLKLRTIRGLSISFSGIMGFLLIMFFAFAAIIGFYFGAIMWIGEMIGSYALASVLIALLFVIITAILIAKRKKLFVNTFVKMFVDVFFEEEEEDANEKL